MLQIMLRVTLAQINPTVGDITGNIEIARRAGAQAAKAGAAMIVFPELSLTGYYPGDLLDEPAFLSRVDAGLATLLEATREHPQLHWVVGAPLRREGPGKPLHNGLLVLRDGKIVLRYAKQLLPTYGIFDEMRHFEPGPDVARVLRIGDTQVGFQICEDGWNDDHRHYAVNPFQRLADAAPDLVVSINASPSNVGKREYRHQLFSRACARHGFPLLYVAQVGGQDQLVYDGASFAVTPQDGVVFEAARFQEDIATLEFSGRNGIGTWTLANGVPPPAVSRTGLPLMEFYRRQIVLGLRDYARRCGFDKAVVGSSGGIDSAITLALAAEALGAANVAGVTMPSRYSSAGSVDDSRALCANLGVTLYKHPIRELLEAYASGFADAFAAPLEGLARENVQARIRGTILMEYSNAFGHLLLTTGNKSELSVGYCTLYGDTNGGLGLIGDIYKTEVFELARHINHSAGRELIPNAIIEKEPSAELAPNQRDSDSLPPYAMLDTILKYLIEGASLGSGERTEVETGFASLSATGEGAALIKRIKRMIARAEYKRRQAPPILRVRARAFGSGRQMPIAAHIEY
jgi:NAD+ synthase (glutamine-hydrolysing)